VGGGWLAFHLCREPKKFIHMCGIAGFANWHGKVGVEALEAASRAIAHRGPDDHGLRIIPMQNGVGQVGLANRRLAILDLSPAGHQPMSDPATGNWIAYNGEVYNFREVRAQLEGEGVEFESQTDTEVILKSYAVWGLSCLDRFRGMFAMALWDHAEQRLLLARDRLGKKPLYYYAGEGFLLFASEVRALLATGLVPKSISQEALQRFLCFGSVCAPEAIIEGILSLSAGSCLTWQRGKTAMHEYWNPVKISASSDARGSAGELSSPEKTISKLRPLLTEAINLRMVSDVPVGVFLSGGIDSSALVAVLAGTQGQKINTFAVVFKEDEYSEARFSSLIARRFQTEHHEINLNAEDFLASVPEAIAAMDQPSLDGFNTFIISREVRRTGLKVALSGQGGDELFAGYDTFRSVPSMEKFQSFMRFVPSPIRSILAAVVPDRENNDRGRKLAALVEGNGSLVHPYFLSRMVFVPREQARLLKNKSTKGLREGMLAALAPARPLDPVNRVSYLELTNYLAHTLLRDSDCMSMANGLEIRAPFLDHHLVEYMLSIPGDVKINAKTPKHLLVKAMNGLLPDEIVYRPKKGFTFPFEHWLRGQLNSEVVTAFKKLGDGPLGSFLDSSAVMQVWQGFLDEKTSWARPWSLYVLDCWCRKNL
jgi:asparagine synthase (glutamine-hydrolysing)